MNNTNDGTKEPNASISNPHCFAKATQCKQSFIPCVMGPTASGKSAIAMQLAEELPIEIISVDSAMVYKGMDIGTAKPSAEDLKKVPHHLIDIRDPLQSYSAADFCKDATAAIQEIKSRGNIPLLVGGTMLYFKALQQGLSALPAADQAVREKLSDDAEKIGWDKMHARLEKIDPIAAKKISVNDSQRIQRALEVYELTGKPISEFYNEKQKSEYQFTSFAIMPQDRKVLHDKIKMRFEQMLADGFIDEVKKLYDRGDLHCDLPSVRAVGYRQAWDYLDNKLSFADMKERAIAATRQLAKRQFTWLRSWPDLECFDATDIDRIQLLLRKKVF